MHDASRYIDDLLTVNFPEFEEVMYRARGEVDPQGTTGGPLTGIYPNTFSNDGTEQQGLVLERVQPENTLAEKSLRIENEIKRAAKMLENRFVHVDQEVETETVAMHFLTENI